MRALKTHSRINQARQVKRKVAAGGLIVEPRQGRDVCSIRRARMSLLNQRKSNEGGSGRRRPLKANGSGIRKNKRRRGPQVGMQAMSPTGCRERDDCLSPD